jgi:hypothetical protein
MKARLSAAKALSHDWKGKLSPALYIAGISPAQVSRWVGPALYTVVAVIWLVPNRHSSRVTARN